MGTKHCMQVEKMKVFILHTLCVLCVLGIFSVGAEVVHEESVKEGHPITLQTGIEAAQENKIRWYFNNTCIAEITGDQHKICTDDQCQERFRDRLKLDDQTGSLTITDTRTTDSGLYKVHIWRSRSSTKSFSVTVTGLSGVDNDRVSVMEGNSVTLHTDVKTVQQGRFAWYFNDIRITKGQSVVCTDVQCKDGDERFRDRLKLDNQTGSLTITNTRTTDSGLYIVQIGSSSKIFIVSVSGVPDSEQNEMANKSVKEGESVTLDPGVIKSPNDVMTWCFTDIRIAEIAGNQSKICTDDRCDEIFRDRLKLDHQTGSLTITNTRTTDAGPYRLEIISSSSGIRRHLSSISVTSVKNFSVSVIGSGLSSGEIAGIVVVLLAVVAVIAGVIYCHNNRDYTSAAQNSIPL